MQSDNRRQDDATVKVIAERIDNLHDHISDMRETMKESMKEMTLAVNKLIRIEEGQIHMIQAHDRLSTQLTKQEEFSTALEKRIDALEKEQPETRRIIGLAYKALWMAAVAAVSFIAKTVGLI